MKTIFTKKCKEIILKNQGVNLVIKGYAFFVDKENKLGDKDEIPNLTLADLYKKNPNYNESFFVTNPLKNEKDILNKLFDITYVPNTELRSDKNNSFGSYKIRFDQSLNPTNEFGLNTEEYYNSLTKGFDAIILIGQEINEEPSKVTGLYKSYIAAFIIPDTEDEFVLPKINDENLDLIQPKIINLQLTFSNEKDISALSLTDEYKEILDNSVYKDANTHQLMSDVFLSDKNCDEQIDLIKETLRKDFPATDKWYNTDTKENYYNKHIVLADETSKINTPWSLKSSVNILTENTQQPQLMLSYMFKDSDTLYNNGLSVNFADNNLTIGQNVGNDNLQIDIFTENVEAENKRCIPEKIKAYNIPDYDNVKNCNKYLRVYSFDSIFNEDTSDIVELYSSNNELTSSTDINLLLAKNNTFKKSNDITCINSSGNNFVASSSYILNSYDNKTYFDNSVLIDASSCNSNKFANSVIIGASKSDINYKGILIGTEGLYGQNNVVFGKYNTNKQCDLVYNNTTSFSSFCNFNFINKHHPYNIFCEDGDRGQKIVVVGDGYCNDDSLVYKKLKPTEIINGNNLYNNKLKRLDVFSIEKNLYQTVATAIPVKQNGKVVNDENSWGYMGFTKNISASFNVRCIAPRYVNLFIKGWADGDNSNTEASYCSTYIDRKHTSILENTCFHTSGINYSNGLLSNFQNALDFKAISSFMDKCSLNDLQTMPDGSFVTIENSTQIKINNELQKKGTDIESYLPLVEEKWFKLKTNGTFSLDISKIISLYYEDENYVQGSKNVTGTSTVHYIFKIDYFLNRIFSNYKLYSDNTELVTCYLYNDTTYNFALSLPNAKYINVPKDTCVKFVYNLKSNKSSLEESLMN